MSVYQQKKAGPGTNNNSAAVTSPFLPSPNTGAKKWEIKETGLAKPVTPSNTKTSPFASSTTKKHSVTPSSGLAAPVAPANTKTSPFATSTTNKYTVTPSSGLAAPVTPANTKTSPFAGNFKAKQGSSWKITPSGSLSTPAGPGTQTYSANSADGTAYNPKVKYTARR